MLAGVPTGVVTTNAQRGRLHTRSPPLRLCERVRNITKPDGSELQSIPSEQRMLTRLSPAAPRLTAHYGSAFVSFTWRVGVMALLLSTLATVNARSLRAQAAQNRAVIGQVQDPQGTGLTDVTVRITRDTVTRITRTDRNGRYRFSGLTDGSWVLTAQRIGYTPYVAEILVALDGVRHDVALSPRTSALDSVLVSARWTGVRGVAYDARSFTPLIDARVTVLGAVHSDTSDANGVFSIEAPGAQSAVVRVERPGFLPVMRSVVIPDGRYVELDVPLDTANPAPNDNIDVKDLQLRLSNRGAYSVVVAREELLKTGARSATSAITESSSGHRKSILIGRDACVFVNGRARPGFPIDAVRVEDVEFIEAYPAGADFSNTLERRWPPGAECGAPGIRERGESARGRIRWVSVWLKQ